VTYKGDVLPFQCMSLDQSMSVTEIDGLSLIFTDFYILALAPLLSCSLLRT